MNMDKRTKSHVNVNRPSIAIISLSDLLPPYTFFSVVVLPFTSRRDGSSASHIYVASTTQSFEYLNLDMDPDLVHPRYLIDY